MWVLEDKSKLYGVWLSEMAARREGNLFLAWTLAPNEAVTSPILSIHFIQLILNSEFKGTATRDF